MCAKLFVVLDDSFILISSDCVLIFDWQVILSLYTIGVLFQDSSVNLSRTTRLSRGFSLYQKCARRILRQTLFLRRMAELIAQAALSAVRAVSLLGNDESGLPQLSQGPAHRGLRKLQLFRYRRDRGPVLCLFVMMCVFGYYSWTQLSIEAYPDIADVTSQVVTQVPGLAAEEVEQQITIPLERAINGLPGMHVMRSKSTFGLSMITIVFKDGTEDYWSRQRVQERLNEVELPYGAAPGLDPLTSPVGEVYRYIIESDQHSLRELTDLQNWVVIPRIKEVSGVADVTNFGGNHAGDSGKCAGQ